MYIFDYIFQSKDKMVRGDRRGCVKLKNAQMGINDEDDSTFTITVDSKILHFQGKSHTYISILVLLNWIFSYIIARDAEERQKWLDALQEARDLHTENYALLQHVSTSVNRVIQRCHPLRETLNLPSCKPNWLGIL